MYSSIDLVSTIFENQQSITSDEEDLITKIDEEFTQPHIDSRLSGVYNVPFDSYPDTPTVITAIATKLTSYMFVVFPGVGGAEQFDYAEELKNQAEEALNRLASQEDLIHELEDEDSLRNEARSEPFWADFIFVGNVAGHEEFGNFDENVWDYDDDIGG